MAIMRAGDASDITETEQPQPDGAARPGGEHSAALLVRVAAHRDRINQAVKELESEKFELLSRLEHLHRLFDSVERGFDMQIADIEDTLKLYADGLHSVPMQTH